MATFLSGLAFATLVAGRAHATETVLEDFEGPAGLASWVFYDGAEFPGATGSLSSGQGHLGTTGAQLAYDFSGGGHYVSATLALTPPVTAAAIGFWAKVPPGMHAKLRVTDASGQTLQYDLSRPLEAFDGAAWFRQVVALSAPTSHFGGANDGVVHEPLASVTILAADPIEPGAKGAIDFDEVVAIDSLAVRLDPASAALSPAPPASSDLASRLGVNIHFTKDDRALDLAAGAGFTRVRMDLGWSGVERTAGVYDFSAFDGLVTALASRGMRLLLILDYFNPLYPGSDAATFATTTVPAFALVAEAAAAHFKGEGVDFEIWNEPNLDGFWPPKADAASYAVLAKAAIAAVHAGDAAAKVTTAGVSGFDTAFIRTYLQAGGADGADAIGVHPYRQGGGESASDDLLLLRSIVAGALPASPPVWDTEWGYSSAWYGAGTDAAARATQAQRVARELLSAWALGFPTAIYYDIRDDGTDATNAEHNFGLVQNDYADKPAMVAVRTLTRAASGRTFGGFVPLVPSSLHAMRLDARASFLVALWSDAPGSATSVTVPAGTTAIDLLGTPVALTTSGAESSVTVRADDGPLYLALPRSAVPADAGAGGSGDSGPGGSPSGSSGGLGGASGGGSSGSAGSGTFDASVPDAGGNTVATGDGSARAESGCGCRFATNDDDEAWLVALSSAATLVARRRRRAARSRVSTSRPAC